MDTLLGASYCTYAPDTKCYRSGWLSVVMHRTIFMWVKPKVCFQLSCLSSFPRRMLCRWTDPFHSIFKQNASQCPTLQPMCDIGPPGYSYCTYAPDLTCYANGWPPCCSQSGGVNCPKQRPPCRSTPIIPAYCKSFPDTSCYKSGYPYCCDTSNTLKVGSKMWIYMHDIIWNSLLIAATDASNNPIIYIIISSAPRSNPCAINMLPVQITAPMLLIIDATSMVGLHVVPNTAVWIVRRTNLLAIRTDRECIYRRGWLSNYAYFYSCCCCCCCSCCCLCLESATIISYRHHLINACINISILPTLTNVALIPTPTSYCTRMLIAYRWVPTSNIITTTAAAVDASIASMQLLLILWTV